MNIRPHHLWVLQGVMERNGDVMQIVADLPEERRVWKELHGIIMQNPNSKIMIVDSLDYICMRCPNTDGNRCLKYSRLDDVDREALTQFGLDYGKEYRAKEIIRLLKKYR